jgi:hypothetical protein
MRACALVELGDPEVIGLFLREEDAEWALEECLRDQPQRANQRASLLSLGWSSSTSGTSSPN